MKKTIFIFILGLIIGILTTIALFYDGYGVSPVIQWHWSLNDNKKNCLWIIKEKYYRDNRSYGAAYNETLCIKNKWVD